jgi:hypothetical protein
LALPKSAGSAAQEEGQNANLTAAQTSPYKSARAVERVWELLEH